MENKYGLSRNIPNPIKQIIRKECGFGCVVCGCAIYQYEHIDPIFSEAKIHDPSKMALLCGTCHDYVTKGMWSKDKINQARKMPKSLTTGFSWGAFDVGNTLPVVCLGSLTFIQTKTIIKVLNEPILSFDCPDSEYGPYKLSAKFCNKEGIEIFKITDNEWEGAISNWDIEISGQTITIRRENRDIALKLTVEPPSCIIVEKINMTYKGAIIYGEFGKNFTFTAPNGIAQVGISSSTVIGRSIEINEKNIMIK